MKNPLYPTGSARVIRGGWWYDEEWYVFRPETRITDTPTPTYRGYLIGFRIFRTSEKS